MAQKGDNRERNVGQEVLTSGRELRVHPLAHDPLETHARAHEADRGERECVGPLGLGTRVSHAWLAALPCTEGSGHREQRLEECAQEEPRAGLRAHAVADAADEGPEDEGRDGREGLLICEVERGVAVPWWALEEPGEGQCELQTDDSLLQAGAARRP